MKPESRLTDQQRFDWLRLTRSENVGPRTFRALITNCGGARAALKALPDLARRGGATRPIRVAAAEDIERELVAARRLGVRFVALGEPDYPPLLRQIDSAPPILALRGRAEALRTAAVAIVGSRNASARGSRSPNGWRAAWARPAMSLSQAWRGGSTSAPTSRAWRPAPSACSPAAMASHIRATPCR